MDETAEDLGESLQDLLVDENFESALELLDSVRPADAADLLENLEDDQLATLMTAWSLGAAAAALQELEPTRRAALAERMPHGVLADILDIMPPDEAADFLQEVDPDHRARLLGRMEREEASDVAELLDFPEDSAGRRMSQDFVGVGEEMTADQVIETLRNVPEEVELIYYVYVLGGSEQLKGVVSLRRLITAAPNATVASLMEADIVSARPTDTVEEVVDIVRRYNLLALPITDDFGRMLGIVTVDDVLEAMEEEAEQDVLRFAGSIQEEQRGANRAWPALRRRLPWLGAATIIELALAYLLLKPLEKHLLVTAIAFVPLLVFVGGNTAVQAATRVLVRLGSERTETWSPWVQASKEIKAGAILAALAGGLAFPFLFLLGRGWEFAAVVAPALAITVLLGAAIGAALPIVLQRLRLDPAIASGPLLGSAMDIVSLFVYVTLALTFSKYVL